MYVPITKEFLERQKLYEPYLVDGHLENAPAEAAEAFEKNKSWLDSQFGCVSTCEKRKKHERKHEKAEK